MYVQFGTALGQSLEQTTAELEARGGGAAKVATAIRKYMPRCRGPPFGLSAWLSVAILLCASAPMCSFLCHSSSVLTSSCLTYL